MSGRKIVVEATEEEARADLLSQFPADGAAA